MTHKEFYDIQYNIIALVGRQTDWLVPEMDREERLQNRAAYDTLCENLFAIVENRPQQAAALSCYADKFSITGTTPTLKPFAYYRSAGMLYVNKELVLQCATVADVFEYLISH